VFKELDLAMKSNRDVLTVSAGTFCTCRQNSLLSRIFCNSNPRKSTKAHRIMTVSDIMFRTLELRVSVRTVLNIFCAISCDLDPSHLSSV
jgi:hypothetical protein